MRSKIVDARVLRLSDSRLARLMRNFEPGVVGITSIPMKNLNAHKVAALERANAPKSKPRCRMMNMEKKFYRFEYWAMQKVALYYNSMPMILLQKMYNRHLIIPIKAILSKIFRKKFIDNNKYDILLIYPKFDKDHNLLCPFSLLSLCTPDILNKYKVKIIDQRIERNCLDNIDRILEKGIICVGLTFFSGKQIQHAVNIIDHIKSRYPDVSIVVGGVHASILPEQTLEYPGIDIVVAGEGETFAQLVRALDESQPIDSVKGLFFKKNGGIVQTGKQQSINLNDFHRIPYHLLGDYQPYYFMGCLLTSRGCPEKCAYCVIPVLNPIYKAMNPELIIQQIKDAKPHLNLFIMFLDDNFFANIKRVNQLLTLIENEGIKFYWWAECRIDYLLKMDDFLLRRLKKNGMLRMFLGAESGSDRVLGFINKNITVEMIKKANLRLKKFGIVPEYMFMAGFPTETKQEIKATISLIKELKHDYPKALVWRLNKYTPFPGTKLFDMAVNEGFSPPQNLLEWSNMSYYRDSFGIDFDKST